MIPSLRLSADLKGALAGSLAVLALLLLAPPLAGQEEVRTPWEGVGLQMSRAELVDLRDRLEAVAASSAYSSEMKELARRNVEQIRTRLEKGDFRVGDRIILEVQGESDLTGTFPVEPGPRIVLPVIGAIPLGGVLRAELEAHLTRELGRYIQDPVVTARSEVRVAILGGVGKPGFYTLPADMLISEALMAAGGPAQNAELDELRIERGDREVWEGRGLQEAVTEGRTLDQLSVRAGDEIHVPVKSGGQNYLWRVGRYALVLGSTLLFGVRLFLP